jgi:DNA polymerase
MRDRGKPLQSPYAPHTFVTVHPSSLLRARDEASRKEGYELFIADLRTALRAMTDA